MEITLDKVKEWLESFPEEPYSMTRLYVTWLLRKNEWFRAQLEEMSLRYAARSAENIELRNKLNRHSLG